MADIKATDGAWLARLLELAPKLAFENGCNPLPEGGFRLVTNIGPEGGQEIDHLHFHILGAIALVKTCGPSRLRRKHG